MINTTDDRGIYILTPTVPSSTETIDYTVSLSGQLNGSTSISSYVVFVGKTRYFGGTYEVDCSDWIDSFITKYNRYNGSLTTVTKCVVSVVFTYTSDQNLTSTQNMSYTWTPETISLPQPTFGGVCGEGQIKLYNSGYVHYNQTSSPLTIKLLTYGGQLIGQTDNIIDKTTYMDKYGDTHNASATNKFEIECYVDPDWFHIKGRNSGITYNKLMTAMQTARTSFIGSPSSGVINIPGIQTSGGATFEGRVKDVEKVEMPSTYNVNRKVPTMKITFELYR